MTHRKKNNFNEDEKWGSYWEGALNDFIEPFFNEQLNKKNKIISWTSLRSSDIYPNKRDWYKFDTLYHIYNYNDPNPIQNVKFEIKTEKFRNTGNICIEKTFKRKPSGIFHTEADYFIYYLPRYNNNNLYLLKPNLVTPLLEKFNNKLRSIGDNSSSSCYIIDKEEFDSWVIENKVGKVLTWNTTIPEIFNIEKFENENENKVVYSGTKENWEKDINNSIFL